MRLRFTADAEGDLEQIHSYIAKDDPHAATRVVGRIRQVTEHLRTFPYLGHFGAVAGTLEVSVPGLPYIVVYQVAPSDEDEVVILRVFHGARDRE